METYIQTGIELIKRYRIEVFLLTCSIVTIVVSVTLFSIETTITKAHDVSIKSIKTNQVKPPAQTIYVDISGAVKKPNMYQLKKGSRVHDLLKIAGGLSENVDMDFFNKQFNRAKLLNDQEKYYVPSIGEIAYATNQDFTSNTELEKSNLISINTADEDELDSLPGVGEVTIENIIENRPYKTIDELITKKAVKQNVFEQIKTRISL